MRYPKAPGGKGGFSLVEVMVALIIICVGLLGIAKLEALMLSSTGTSRLRALVALQAASLADAMHADRDYWDGSATTYWNPANGPLALTGTETTSGTTTNTAWSGTNAPPVSGGPDCLDAVCNSEQLAQYDLALWASNLAQVLKTSTSSIACYTDTGTGLVSCTIMIQWNENTVAANSQEAAVGAPTAFQTQTYTLVVEP
ncbi:MAG: prepilin-type N-terminal cleavage/methylation domain-containing protein [Steroidobacteraceae bacterium]